MVVVALNLIRREHLGEYAELIHVSSKDVGSFEVCLVSERNGAVSFCDACREGGDGIRGLHLSRGSDVEEGGGVGAGVSHGDVTPLVGRDADAAIFGSASISGSTEGICLVGSVILYI